jgi:propanol-preferring alcohol dehydrogenase
MVAVGKSLELFDVPVPRVGDRDVLVRVKAAGICHSDIHDRAGTSPVRPLPMTLGHEMAGVVEEAGASARDNLRPGDRGVLHFSITCGDRGNRRGSRPR